MAILKVRDPVTGEFKGVPAIKGDTGEKGEKGDKGDPGEATGDISEAVANFTESAERTNLTTGDTIKNQFSKIKKWFSDLKTVAFTGKYNDLVDAPTPVKDLGILTDDNGINFDEYNDANSIAYLHNYTLSPVPNANGILKHYKSENNNYRYQEFTKLYNQQTYKRTYYNGVWKDWTLINSAHVESTAEIDIIAYAENLATDNDAGYFGIIRGYNCTNEPNSMGAQGIGDYYYQIFKVDTQWITICATDVRSGRVFTINKNNGVWDVNWKNMRDASTLSGAQRTDLLQHYVRGDGIDFKSPKITQPYSANINEDSAVSIGLDHSWWHILYLPHDISGYGCQIAIPLNTTSYKAKYRISYGETWQAWTNFADNGNADTVDGHHAWQQQCLSDTGVAYSYWSFLQWDGAVGRFLLRVDGADGSHHKVQVDNADSVDNLHVDHGTHNTYGLRSIAMDTFDLQAGVTGMSPGHIYIMYE